MTDVPGTTPFPDTTWRASNLGALLFHASDRCVREKLRVTQEGGFLAVSAAQLTLFHHLDCAGVRLTVLASQANVTKQSMIELVDRAEAMGLVKRRPDPHDRRAKVVYPTLAGSRLLACLRDGIKVADQDVLTTFGRQFLLETQSRLREYTQAATAGPQPKADDKESLFDNLGRLFGTSARRFSREALSVAHGRGWHSVNEVSLGLYRNLDLAGARLTDIAALARVTKQTMREMVDRAEGLGFVVRRQDPADGRAKTIDFTQDGLSMLADVRYGLEVAEARLRERTGDAFATRLRDRLQEFAAR
ncbi:MarR family winged helix-turn-helix transcriptional regulator [Sphingomonas sp. UYP23]